MKHGKLRKICAMIMALALVMASVVSLADPVPEDEISYISGAGTDSGTCGNGVTWSISNGKLTIGGKGKMQDLLTWDAPGYPYTQPWLNRADITSLEIGSGVTHIGLNAFRGLTGLKSVTIPATVEDVGFAAFGDCTGLGEVTIHCKRLGESAFIRCMNLVTVNVGPEVTDMGISAFEDCHGLTLNSQGKVCITDLEAWCKIVFGGLLANPLEKATHLYLNGSELTTLTVPAGITKINDYAFINAFFLTSVTLPEGLTEIGEYAFYSCMGIKTLNLPANSLKKIGGYAFESCTGLTSLATFPASIETFGPYAFRFDPLPEFTTIPAGHIGRGAFESCGTIADLTLGADVTFIGENAFKGLPLRQVTYAGTQEHWDAIPKGDGNDSLLNAPLTCLGGNAQAGTYTGKKEVTFGKYDGQELTWLLLDSQNGKTLLLSKNILEFRNYDGKSTNVSWAASGMRAWLNGTFLNTFTAAEQAKIAETELAASKNARYGTSTGEATKDKIFLLSEEEVHKYFPLEETAAAKCTAGAYARSNKDSAISDPNGSNSFGNTSYWWLRTKGMYGYQAAYVDYIGYVHGEGMVINNNIAGARPAMWVDSAALYGGVYDFVTRCYKLILGRDPDAGGLQGWCDALMSKTAAAANIIDSFVKSDEFVNRKVSAGESVDILYNTMLGRAADEGGKAGWVDALNQGYSLQHIIAGFCGSPEFMAICKDFGIEPGTVNVNPVTPQADESTPRGKIEAFVKRCYKLILGRDADEGGLKGWSDALEQRTAAAAQIIDGFVRSDEYSNRNLAAGESVDILYNTMLGRAADSAGRAGWVDALGQGYTLQHIINGFCGSAEFTAICENYGIVAGSVAVSGVVVKREAITPEGDEAEAPVVYQGYNSEFINEEKIRAFVEHCYVAVFGREGDAEGVENYTALILDGKKTPKSVAKEFVFSAEFQGKLPGNEEFIRILYRLYFDREPGAEEVAGWVQMLEDGASLEEIVDGFAASAEFKAIVNGMKN